MVDKLQPYLVSTSLIESGHPEIEAMAVSLCEGLKNPTKIAERIFSFIRDDVRYAFSMRYTEDSFRASTILRARRGFCTMKTILFCALARNRGIPAGIHFYDIVDHRLSERFYNLLRTNVFYHHGIVELYLDGRWIQFDATLDRSLSEKDGLQLVEFSTDGDCLLPEKTPDGRNHVEYIKDFGCVSDVSVDEIRYWFEEGYPHLYEKHNSR